MIYCEYSSVAQSCNVDISRELQDEWLSGEYSDVGLQRWENRAVPLRENLVMISVPKTKLCSGAVAIFDIWETVQILKKKSLITMNMNFRRLIKAKLFKQLNKTN